jgi:hypothetical protein
VTTFEAYQDVLATQNLNFISAFNSSFADSLFTGYYPDFLRRPADASALSFWASQLASNPAITDFSVIQTLLGTQEYVNYVVLNPPPMPPG